MVSTETDLETMGLTALTDLTALMASAMVGQEVSTLVATMVVQLEEMDHLPTSSATVMGSLNYVIREICTAIITVLNFVAIQLGVV